MTESTLVESVLLRYPGVACVRVVHTVDGLVAQVLPWDRRSGRPGTGPVAQVAEVNPSETTFLHDEIFLAESYLQGGIVLRADAIVFDVGANIGMFAMFVAARCPSARVFAFEPVAQEANILKSTNSQMWMDRPALLTFQHSHVGHRVATTRAVRVGLAPLA